MSSAGAATSDVVVAAAVVAAAVVVVVVVVVVVAAAVVVAAVVVEVMMITPVSSDISLDEQLVHGLRAKFQRAMFPIQGPWTSCSSIDIQIASMR